MATGTGTATVNFYTVYGGVDTSASVDYYAITSADMSPSATNTSPSTGYYTMPSVPVSWGEFIYRSPAQVEDQPMTYRVMEDHEIRGVEVGVSIQPAPTSASKKAEELLLSILTDEQRKEYLEKQTITLEALGKKYTLIKGRSGNIYELDDGGKPLRRLCAHVAPPIPNEDNLIAQVLALRTHPQTILSIANVM